MMRLLNESQNKRQRKVQKKVPVLYDLQTFYQSKQDGERSKNNQMIKLKYKFKIREIKKAKVKSKIWKTEIENKSEFDGCHKRCKKSKI